MTAVLRFEKRNFADKITTDGIQRGIDKGGLIALKNHNEREQINSRMEVKSKQSENINTSLSGRNIYFKKMRIDEIKEIKNTHHRENGVGAFEMVFDFQDLIEEEREAFDVIKHKQLIENYLESANIPQHFKILSFVYHADEFAGNPHFHIIFSGIDKQTGTFGVNEFFNPKATSTEIETDKDGNAIYLIENRGKRKGLPKLDADGNKIPKLKKISRNGTQWLQDTWSEHLTASGSKYFNMKEFTSVLNFTKGVWRRFDKETKERVLLIREVEKERIKAIRDDDNETRIEIEAFMREEVITVLQIAQEIQIDIAIERKQKGRTKTLAPKQ
jgi:hypothetical protein